MSTHLTCDGVARRDFLRVGALAGLGIGLSDYLTLAGHGGVSDAKAKSAIFVRLGGGPSHMDTFDLKPDAPETHRGEFKPIKTNADGVMISEHLPKLAKCADKFVILRGVSHTLAAHNLGTLYMNTGNRPLPSLNYPHYGAVVAKEIRGTEYLPSFIAIPSLGENATGYLGVEYGPFETGGSPQPGKALEVRGLALRNGVTMEDVDRRQDMVKRYDNAFGEFAREDKLLAGMDPRQDMVKRYDNAFGEFAREDKLLAGMDQFGQKAYAMMRSSKARDAFDTGKESPSITKLFGSDQFSQSCLLATRLIESGVRFTSVSLGGWDTHSDNFTALKNRNLPPLDAGLSGLFTALASLRAACVSPASA